MINIDNIKGKYFIDTNVLIYSFDQDEPIKMAAAQNIIQHALFTQQGMISTQVVQEFLNLTTRKFAQYLSIGESKEYTAKVLAVLCKSFPSLSFYERALNLHQEMSIAFYDALILTAAIDANCNVLLSEDFQHQRVVRGIKIVNPFV